jgi:hypothetical protein
MSKSTTKEKRAFYLNCSNSAILDNCVSNWRTYCTSGGTIRTDYTAYCGLYCGCEWDGVCARCDKSANATETATETVQVEADVEKREESN